MNATTRNDVLMEVKEVPEMILRFWIIKILVTTVGETTADFPNCSLNFDRTGTSYAMSALLAVAIGIQLKFRCYVSWL